MVTPVQLARRMAAYDALVFQLVVSDATGASPAMSVQVEHSADGRIWMPFGPVPEIDSLALNLGAPTSAVGAARRGRSSPSTSTPTTTETSSSPTTGA